MRRTLDTAVSAGLWTSTIVVAGEVLLTHGWHVFPPSPAGRVAIAAVLAGLFVGARDPIRRRV